MAENRKDALQHFKRTTQRFQIVRYAVLLIILAIVTVSAVAGAIFSNQAARRATEASDRAARHLNCVVAFFAQTDRANLNISDIDKCVLQRGSNPADTFTPPQVEPEPKPEPEPQSRAVQEPVATAPSSAQTTPVTNQPTPDTSSTPPPPAEVTPEPLLSIDLPLLPEIKIPRLF